MNRLILGLFCVLALGCTHDETSAPPSDHHAANTPSHPAAADTAARTDTAVNARDRSSTAVTPIDQSEKPADIQLDGEIRRQVVGAKLSVDAQNVKIVTQNGKVTLRGPVASQEEKDKIEAIAAKVAGATNVDDHLEVSTKNVNVNNK